MKFLCSIIVNFLDFYLTPKGRINRVGFIKKLLLIFFIQLALGLMLVGYEHLNSNYKAFLHYIGMAILISCYVHPVFALFGIGNTIVQRFHDMGKRAWWRLSLILIPLVLCSFMISMGNTTGHRQYDIENALSFLLLIATTYYLALLCIKRGERGSNRFGEVPR